MGTVTASPLRRYGVTLFCLAAAAQFSRYWSSVSVPLSFWPFLLAVMVAARCGGRGPGLLASLGSTLAISYLLLPPVHSLRVERMADFLWLELFVLASFLLGRRADRRPVWKP